MKVLFIAHDSLKGGSGCCLYELLSLIKSEDNVTPVVLCHNNNSLTDALKKKGIETYFCRFGYTLCGKNNLLSRFFWGKIYRPLANFGAYLFLSFKIDLKKIDLIFSNSMIIDFGAYLHRKIKKPLVSYIREFGDLDFHLTSLESCLPKYISCNSAKILTVSHAVRNHFIELGGDCKKIKCVYDGVVKSRFFEDDVDTVDKSCIKIVMSGRLSEEKGQKYAIEAINLLPSNLKNCINLDFYGSGRDEKKLKELVKKFKLENQVCFKGFCSNLPSVLSHYDVGLNLSESEGFGRTTVEYMLSGLFVIGANSGATPEILSDGKLGKLVRYNDSLQIADSIVFFYNNREACKNIAKAGNCFATQFFDIEKNYKSILHCLRV